MDSEYINIPKIYKRNTTDLLLFGYVSGIKTAMPSMTVRDCIKLFQDEFNLTEDDYPLETARFYYYSMLKEFKEVKCNV